MTDDEYRELLAILFERYVRPRLPRVRRRFRHHMMEEWDYHLDQAERAAQVLRFIDSQINDDEEIYGTFTLQRLRSTVADTRNSLEFANRAMDEAGFLEIFDTHGSELLDGLAVQHLPDIDKEVIRNMGSLNPEAELAVLVLRAKRLRHRIDRSSGEVSTHQELRRTEERLAEAEKELGQAEKETKEGANLPKPTKSRRWFKGLGQICQGAALSIANVALAAGVLRFPVSPETQTWGAVASVTTGVGTILAGVGDLRNE